MQKTILIVGAVSVALLASLSAFAAEQDLRIIQTGSGASQYTRLITPPGAGNRCLLGLNGDIDDPLVVESNPMPKPRCYKIGAGLSVTGDYIGGYTIAATGGGTPGPKGDKGDTGATGPAGPAGADGVPGTTDYLLLINRPTLGTAAARNVPASGNAAAAEVVLGADGRLTDARTPTAHTHTAGQISDATSAGRALLTAADASAIRSLISVPSAADIAAAYYPLASNPAGYLLPAALTPYQTASAAAAAYAAKATTLAGYGITDGATAASVALKADTSTVNTALAGKFATPSCPPTQYLRGDGSCATFPTIPAGQVQSDWNASSGLGVILNKPTLPVINRAVVTTAADGTFVWTLPTACAAGQLPVVSLTPESNTAGDAISHRVTARTNSTVSIFAGRSAALSVLTVTVLGIPAGAAVPIHAIAICP